MPARVRQGLRGPHRLRPSALKVLEELGREGRQEPVWSDDIQPVLVLTRGGSGVGTAVSAAGSDIEAQRGRSVGVLGVFWGEGRHACARWCAGTSSKTPSTSPGPIATSRFATASTSPASSFSLICADTCEASGSKHRSWRGGAGGRCPVTFFEKSCSAAARCSDASSTSATSSLHLVASRSFSSRLNSSRRSSSATR